jgi:pSer/pThr/pTyr-binding forkhead associated (FHA) protein
MTTTIDPPRNGQVAAPSASAELRADGRVFPLVAPGGRELSLGRHSEAAEGDDRPDIDLADLPNGRTVSRHHARLYERDGEWFLRVETGALNPTSIDDEPVPPGLEISLEHGQSLQVGAITLQFYQPGAAVELVDDDQIELRVEPFDVHVEPGAAVTTSVRVVNFTDHVDQFIVEVRGLPSSWYSITYLGVTAKRAEVGLFQTQSRLAPSSDAQAQMQILFNPPRECRSFAGARPYTVRVTTRSAPRQRREQKGMLTILPFGGVNIDSGMAQVRRRKGSYSWVVHNTGNAPATIDLSARPTDITGTGMFARIPRSLLEIGKEEEEEEESEPRIETRWQAQQITLDACESKRVQLAVRVLNRHWWGDRIQYHFTVTAASGAAIATEESYLESPPRISTAIQSVVRWIMARLPFLLALAGFLWLFWTFFQLPEINFQVESADIAAGEPVRLRWVVKHATFFTVENSNIKGQRIGFFNQLDETRDNGNAIEKPEQTTRYVFRATNGLGLASSDDQTVHVRPAPRIVEFTTTPSIIQQEGDPVEISWKISGDPGHRVTTLLTAIVPRENAVPRVLEIGELKGVYVDHPVENETLYELWVSDRHNSGDGANIDAMQKLVSVAPAQLDNLTVSPAEVTPGGLATLRWTGQRFTSLSLRAGAAENDESQPAQAVDPNVVELDVHPAEDTWYSLTASNLAGSSTKRLKLSVLPETTAPPKLDFFVATPTSVEQGETAALTFSAQNADSVLLRDGGGRVIVQRDTSGSPSVLQTINIAPDQSGVYALTIANAGGEITQAVTVMVRPAPPPPPAPPEPTPGPAEAPPG